MTNGWTAHVVRSEVTRLCGFRDGSCDDGQCGAGIVIQAFTKTLGWVPINKKMWIGDGSGRLWYVNGKFASLHRQERALTMNTIHCCGCVSLLQLHFSVECPARGWIVAEPSQPRPLGRGRLVARVCGGLFVERGSGHSSVK